MHYVEEDDSVHAFDRSRYSSSCVLARCMSAPQLLMDLLQVSFGHVLWSLLALVIVIYFVVVFLRAYWFF